MSHAKAHHDHGNGLVPDDQLDAIVEQACREHDHRAGAAPVPVGDAAGFLAQLKAIGGIVRAVLDKLHDAGLIDGPKPKTKPDPAPAPDPTPGA